MPWQHCGPEGKKTVMPLGLILQLKLEKLEKRTP
jgi:hypothetical protein